MKRIFTVLAVGLAATAFAGEASAQAPGMMPYGPAHAGPPPGEGGVIQKQYGLHPGLKRLMPHRLGCHGGCGGGICSRLGAKLGACFGGHIAKHAGDGPPPSGVAGGTLAFPNHPFVRSPRDFFMLDQ